MIELALDNGMKASTKIYRIYTLDGKIAFDNNNEYGASNKRPIEFGLAEFYVANFIFKKYCNEPFAG